MVGVAIAIYVGAAVSVGPVGVTVSDEVSYLTEAQAIAQGKSLRDPDSYAPENGSAAEDGPRYPLGWPALLSPFTRLPWPAPFFVNCGLHLTGTLLLVSILRRRKLDVRWAVLYLSQPSLITYSRTLMADTSATVLTLALVLAAELDSYLAIGVLLGLAPFIKLSEVIVVFPFATVLVAQRWRQPGGLSAVLRLCGAAVPFIGLYLWVNLEVYGHVMGDVDAAGPTLSNLASIPYWALLGLAQVSLAWPLLSVGVIRLRLREAAAAVALIAYLAIYGYHYQGPSLAATVIVGSRLALPAVTLLIPGYASLLQGLSASLRRMATAALLLASAFVPFPILRAVSARRSELEKLRAETLKSLRPQCLVGYTPFANKLLVPFPGDIGLIPSYASAKLETALKAGHCVDLIVPDTEPTTYSGAPNTQSFFGPLISAFPNCDLSDPGAVAIKRLAPAGESINCR